jgi:hypothetical protein
MSIIKSSSHAKLLANQPAVSVLNLHFNSKKDGEFVPRREILVYF